MKTENIMLNEISQTQKDKCRMISLTWDTKSMQNHKDRNWNDGCQDLEDGVKGYCLKGTEFNFKMIK